MIYVTPYTENEHRCQAEDGAAAAAIQASLLSPCGRERTVQKASLPSLSNPWMEQFPPTKAIG